MESVVEIEKEFECQICLDLLFEPVTTPCGHTFCKGCLIKYLRQARGCPVCRAECSYSTSELPINIVLFNIIQKKYPQREAKIRKDQEIKRNLFHIIRDSPKSVFRIPCVFLKDFHIFPKERHILKLKERKYLAMHQMVINTDRKISIICRTIHNESYGYIVSITNSELNQTQTEVILHIKGEYRFKGGQMYIPPPPPTVPPPPNINQRNALHFCDGIVWEDVHPVSGQDQVIQKALKIDRLLENRINVFSRTIISLLKRKVIARYGELPNYSQTMSTEAKLKYALELSFYITSLLCGSKQEKFEKIFTKNTMERINWCEEKLMASKPEGSIFNFYKEIQTGTSKPLFSFMLIIFILLFIYYYSDLIQILPFLKPNPSYRHS